MRRASDGTKQWEWADLAEELRRMRERKVSTRRLRCGCVLFDDPPKLPVLCTCETHSD